MEHEQQAYVPFVYARDCIARVMEDMKKMKGNHIRIVHEIQDSYRQIEDQTQVHIFIIIFVHLLLTFVSLFKKLYSWGLRGMIT